MIADEEKSIVGMHPQYVAGCIIGLVFGGFGVIGISMIQSFSSYAMFTPFIMALVFGIIYLVGGKK